MMRLGPRGMHQIGRDRPMVERIGPSGSQRPHRGGERRILQQRADRHRVALQIIEIRARCRIALQAGLALQQPVQAGRDRESVLRELDRRLEEPRPLQPAMVAMNSLEHPQHPGDAHRQAAGRRVSERQRPTVRSEELVPAGSHRGSLAAVIRLHVLTVPVQQKRASSDA